MADGNGKFAGAFLRPPDSLAPVAVAGCRLGLVKPEERALGFPVERQVRGAMETTDREGRGLIAIHDCSDDIGCESANP